MFSYFLSNNNNTKQEEEKPLKTLLDNPPAAAKKQILPFRLPSLDKLKDKHVILASASPRRLDILAQVGIHPRVIPSTFEETLSKDDYLHNPHAYPINTATEKGKEVYERLVLEDDKNSPDLVISADTVVLVPDDAPSLSKGQSYDEVINQPLTYSICEKPKDADDQYRMLADASGRELQVVTGVCITYPILQSPGYAQKTFANMTKVHFFDNDHDVIEKYIETGEGIDRAGGFALQGLGSLLIQGIEGDYNNVVGFPLSEFIRFLDTLIENDDGVLDL
ncbi:Maf/Ham1 [Wallemia mellicola CBS 633.66]|uniref:Maf/Ham1 n=1 Tax=Wallemia mellicola (strain ATCC MYA-4683 / CBS 633.66) TaxID=671144 RepID=I4YI52_WALMC|nr:Maf/Ham1 [Wallemia mellicola CBS 633.66]EIM23644.1 Maf/Ham1 [Wallemia mellicola CBS 633.66]|eukprot:XP_006956312.1 Maf/Ham1 [Wallemia mellicola CBS 633.66]